MRQTVMIFVIIGGAMLASALSCDECGEECRQSCGTKQFKACCFNYLKKRNSNSNQDPGPDLRLEVSLANSRARQALYGGMGPPLLYQQAIRGPPLAVGTGSDRMGRLQLVYDA